VVASVLAVATPGSSAPPALKQKQAQARRILDQVNALDIQLGRIGEQLNGAKYELDQVRSEERRTAVALKSARAQYRVAQQRVAKRLVTLYDSTPPTAADAIFGAASLSDILDRLQLVSAADALDRQLVTNVQARRDALLAHETALTAERQRRDAAVAAISAHQHTIAAELSQRRTLLSSIQGEVRKLQAEERARQARLAAEARARLIAEAKARAKAAAAAEAAALRAAQAKQSATVHSTTTASSTTTAPDPAPPPPTTTTDGTTTTGPAATTPTATAGTTTTQAEPPPPPPSATGHPEAATIALRYLGIPYVFGGATPDGFDCSGLVMYVFAQLGVSLPHYAAAQYQYGVAVPRSDLQPGDLVFFDGLNHVGIYIGGNSFVHAPHTGDVVKISTITGWYDSTYVGARRI